MDFQWVDVFHHLVPEPLYYVVKWKKTNIFFFEDSLVVKSWWKTIISYLTTGFIKQDFVKKSGGVPKLSSWRGGLEQKGEGAWAISYFEGGIGEKEGETFLGGSYPGAHYDFKMFRVVWIIGLVGIELNLTIQLSRLKQVF